MSHEDMVDGIMAALATSAKRVEAEDVKTFRIEIILETEDAEYRLELVRTKVER